MLHSTDDVRIGGLRPLLPPAILMEELPATELASTTVATARRKTEDILRGIDDRLLVVVGPCSIHDIKAALEYAGDLQTAADEFKDDLQILMRVYFEKPRTTVGWKGLINDPHLDGSFDINNGLRMARGLLLDLANRGLPVGCEFLDTITPQFIADLVAWGAIGARTTESQVHRELASGLSMPVGFKNGTDGNVKIAVDAIGAARNPHHFLSVTKQGIAAIVETKGNDCCHVILRGARNGPNYDAQTTQAAIGLLHKANLPEKIMIDCSHGNSSKNHTKQADVVNDLCPRISAGDDSIIGVMIESHLVAGKQNHYSHTPLVYGQSITDACLAWGDTLPVLEDIAAAVRKRRELATRGAA